MRHLIIQQPKQELLKMTGSVGACLTSGELPNSFLQTRSNDMQTRWANAMPASYSLVPSMLVMDSNPLKL